MDIKVGDKFYCLDANQRSFNPNGHPILEKGFVEVEVISENSKSYEIKASGQKFKVSKKAPFDSYGQDYGLWKKLMTEKDMKDYVYIKNNLYKVVDKMRTLSDANVLKQIEEILKSVEETA